MILTELNILNYKNIREAHLNLADKINCFIGLNGQGKTNVIDTIYYLSFTKSAYNVIDSQNITHGEDMAMIQGSYLLAEQSVTVTCGIRRKQKKLFRLDRQEYKRLTDHIGLIPLVMVSPRDSELVSEGSDERRRFLDTVISQYDSVYLDHLTQYNTLLKQRNILLKQYSERPEQMPWDYIDVMDDQLCTHAAYIYAERSRFIEPFTETFNEVYRSISEERWAVSLRYISQLQERDMREAMQRTHERDLILGWTSQGIHKDDIEMLQGEGELAFPLKRVGSQGQQKSYLLAMKFAQALYLTEQLAFLGKPQKPILLLDDLFDKLDSHRMERIIALLQEERFGQIFITDTDRQHLREIVKNYTNKSSIFEVTDGVINPL